MTKRFDYINDPHLLTETFAVRYDPPPSDNDMLMLRTAIDTNADASLISGLTATKYQVRLENLLAPDWLVSTIRRHLTRAADNWRKDNAPGYLHGIGSVASKKRSVEHTQLQSRLPFAKIPRLLL